MFPRLVLATVLWFVPPVLHAGVEADLIARSVQGETLMMARDYEAALALFQRLSEDYPESPAGPFGIMALWQTRMFENRDFRFTTPYYAAEKKMTAICDARLSGERPSDWDMFVCASGFGMKGFFDARRDKWLQGLGGAIRSIRTFKRLLWLNPNFLDAEMGVGMYQFWRSVVTQRLKWLPFFSDERAVGMAKVQRVADGGQYVKDLAKANLAYMAIEMRQYDKALGLLNDLIARYPRNILMRQAKAEVAWFQRRFQDCAAIHRAILAEDPGLGYSHFWLGLLAEQRGDKATAIAEYNQALKSDPAAAKEIRKRIERLKQ